MVKKNITIVTGTGGPLGTGHLQRMLNLVSYLEEKNEFEVSLLIKSGTFPLPEKFSRIKIDRFPAKADLIIRDMRDSEINEILALNKIAPVLAVDDAGEGRSRAAFSIDLLPPPERHSSGSQFNIERFIYGYNFSLGIESLGNEYLDARDIDITIYAGFNPSDELLSSISRSIPGGRRAIILSAGKPVVLTGDPLPDDISYAEILTSSRIVMTHFGITMFEADICGCMVAALNPTRYHSELTDSIKNSIRLVHSAEYKTFDPVLMGDDIENALRKNHSEGFYANDILSRINNGLENFTRYIYKILM